MPGLRSCPENLLDPAGKHTHRKERGTKKQEIGPMRLRYVGYLHTQSELPKIPEVSISPRKHIPPVPQSVLKIIANKEPHCR